MNRTQQDDYPGIWTIWGWDGGFKQPRNVRKRRAAQQRRRRAQSKANARALLRSLGEDA